MARSNRKVFHILFVLYLGVATFSVAATPDVCLCGQACSHGLCEKAETRDHGTHHGRCPEPDCESCNIEKMVSLDIYMFWEKDDQRTSYDAPQGIVDSAEHLFHNATLEYFYPVYLSRYMSSSAIYLRNLSLLF
jgi:hypothetical protein